MAYDSLAAILSRVPFFHGCVVIDVYTMVLAGVYMFSLSDFCRCYVEDVIAFIGGTE